MKRCKVFWPAVVSRLLVMVSIVFLAVPVVFKLRRIPYMPGDVLTWTVGISCLIGAACALAAVIVGTVAVALLSSRSRRAGRAAALAGGLMVCVIVAALVIRFMRPQDNIGPPFALAALIIGTVALVLLSSRARRAGRGAALAGIITGSAILAAFTIFPRGRAMPHARPRSHCRSNLKQIGLACHMYAADNNGEFPDKLSRLYPSYLSVLHIFSCPLAPDSPRLGECIDEESTYLYAPGLSLSSHPHALLACDKPGNHRDGSAAELCVDGHVEWRDPPFEW